MNWKKIWFGILAIGIPLSLLAASIKWYNDAGIPQATSLTGNEILSFQRTSPNSYGWAYVKDVLPAGTGTNITTNYVVYGPNYYTNNTQVSNYFVTNIFQELTTSNYFAEFQYITNLYQTNVTIEQYLTQNSYVSNYTMTNIFANTFVSNYFVTNLFPTTYVYTTNTIGGDFIANLNGVGTNTTLYGDTSFKGDAAGQQTFYDASGIVPLAGFNGTWFWGNGGGLTNLPQNAITVISNTTINTKTLNVTSNITYLTATPQTNAWANGPTGNVDLAISDQNYSAGADMAITGVLNKSNTVVQNVLLTILATGANRTVYLTGSFAESTGATSYVCTNGVPREIWIRYTPALGGLTNVCSLPFYRP